MITYTKARRVVLAQSPSNGECLPVFGHVDCSSTRMMEKLVPDWQDRASGLNAWPRATDWADGSPSAVKQILEQTECEVVIALGVFVQREMRMPKAAVPLETVTVTWPGREVRVLRFPHTSGRNRFWNTQSNIDRARAALEEALSL